MIILFEENEKAFDSLGLGVLKDTLSSSIKEGLNNDFTLTMEYPITGSLYPKIKKNRIIYCKTNPFDNSYQPFRIRSITKPIKGVVTVDAVHVSYDMNGFPVKPISGLNLTDILNKIQYGEDDGDKHINYTLVKDMPFAFKTNIYASRSYKTSAPYNLRALLMGGGEDSILEKYKAEIQFNKFEVLLLSRRGADRGAKIIYGKNMTDFTNISSNDMLYSGVYPYYHSQRASSETETNDGEFKKAYIISDKTFQDGWLSYTKDGEAFHPVTDSPIQIATEGDYYDKVYCWNEAMQRFDEKIYNQSVLLIQDVIEPEWVSIDWSHFPTVTCKAKKKGYFKKSTDTEWGSLKGVGDVVFESSILNSGILENIMLNYSEVIPGTESENKEVEDIIHVELDDPIIYINTIETKQMKHENILTLDLTSEFEEEPTKEQLKNKAEEYISKNKLGISKDNITVSFIDLSQTTEGKKYEKFDHIELGDTVHIIYEELGVNTTLRVISVEYDPILNKYNSIELGEKEEDMSSRIMQSGDNVSSLTNDIGYATVTTVNKLIANTVTAEWLEAVNAKLSKAAIEQLEVERINCKGIIEASQFTLDQLVAKMLIAENAQIAKTLEAGQVKVNGNINVLGGSISINGVDAENQNETYFRVDKYGNVTANSVSIVGGDLNIGNGNFIVGTDGILQAKMAYIQGTIEATSGSIGGFDISDNSITAGSESSGSYVKISTNEIKCGKTSIDNAGNLNINDKFKVDKNGNLNINENFKVDSQGNATAKSIDITGGNIEIDGPIPSDPEVPKKSFKVKTENDDLSVEINGGSLRTGYRKADFGDYRIYVKYSPLRYIRYVKNIRFTRNTVGSFASSGWSYDPDFGDILDAGRYYLGSGDYNINSTRLISGTGSQTLSNIRELVIYDDTSTDNMRFYSNSGVSQDDPPTYEIDFEINETLYNNYVIPTSVLKFEKLYTVTEIVDDQEVEVTYTCWRFYDRDEESGKSDFLYLIKSEGIIILDTEHAKSLMFSTLSDATVKYKLYDDGTLEEIVSTSELDQYIRSSTNYGKFGQDISEGYNFEVDEEGDMTAKSGTIANFRIEQDSLHTVDKNIGELESFWLTPNGSFQEVSIAESDIKANWLITVGNTFGVNKDGTTYIGSGKIGKINIQNGYIDFGEMYGSSTYLKLNPNSTEKYVYITVGGRNKYVYDAAVLSSSIYTSKLVLPTARAYTGTWSSYNATHYFDDLGFTAMQGDGTNKAYTRIVSMDFRRIPVLEFSGSLGDNPAMLPELSGITELNTKTSNGELSYCPKIAVFTIQIPSRTWKQIELHGGYAGRFGYSTIDVPISAFAYHLDTRNPISSDLTPQSMTVRNLPICINNNQVYVGNPDLSTTLDVTVLIFGY